MSIAPMPFPPRDLTIPEPGSTTARRVLSLALDRLTKDVVLLPRRAPASARAEVEILRRLIRDAAPAKGAIMSILRRPTAGGLVRCLRDPSLPRWEEVFVQLVAQIAFELSLAHVLSAPVRLPRAPRRLLSIPERFAMTLPEGEVVFGGTALPASPENDVYHSISADVVLALADNNPLAMVEAHPDKAGNAVDLGGRPASAWTRALATALDRISVHLPELRAEFDLLISQIVPVGYDEQKHLSASYQEIIGTIYCSLHPSSMTLSEALIHEFSHNKLNALFEVDPVLENAWSPLYTSPVRPDPRPLHGVLLAVHAFLPVARLYERMIAAGDPESKNESFHTRFAQIRKINREGAELVLDKGKPTRVGEGLFAEIRRWYEHYEQYEKNA
jgi:HEXXH motif-containing protein